MFFFFFSSRRRHTRCPEGAPRRVGASRSDRPLRGAPGPRPRVLHRGGRGHPQRGPRLRRRMRKEGARVTHARSRNRYRRGLRGSLRAARRRQRSLVALGAERQRQRSGSNGEEGGMSAVEEARPQAAPEVAGTREMTYLEAISDALRTEMRRDESVFCIGEDIGAFGGAFKVTDGFVEEFGSDRCLDAPLAENAIIGAAVGAAVEGLRPICEMQFADFISCGFDQLVNVAAKLHYRQGVAVPMVVRLPSGGGFSGGPFHSQNPEAWFLQAPGLKVVAPATAADAKGLLVSAIRDPNPVCYLEHKGLYRRVKGEVPEGRYETPIGEGRLAREGTDLTVITYGGMVWTALEATEDIDGASVEVLDLRSLVPLDREAILASVRKTSKVLLLQEATRSAGAMAEVAAIIAEHAWEDLDGPVKRVATPDVPIPFSPPLERAILPQASDIEEACRELLAY